MRNESSGNGNGFRLFLLQNSVHSMKCRQTMLHVECRTINHFSRLDKRIKIEITSYSYNFEIVVYSFFDKNIFLSFCMDLGFCCCAKSYPNHAGTRCCSPACFQYRFPSSREILDWALKIKRSERSFWIPFPFCSSDPRLKTVHPWMV